jgi:hypothetical protein
MSLNTGINFDFIYKPLFLNMILTKEVILNTNLNFDPEGYPGSLLVIDRYLNLNWNLNLKIEHIEIKTETETETGTDIVSDNSTNPQHNKIFE